MGNDYALHNLKLLFWHLDTQLQHINLVAYCQAKGDLYFWIKNVTFASIALIYID